MELVMILLNECTTYAQIFQLGNGKKGKVIEGGNQGC